MVAIRVEEDERPQSIAAWRPALPELVSRGGAVPPASGPPQVRPPRQGRPGPGTASFPRWARVTGVVALVVAVGGGAYWLGQQREPPTSGPAVTVPTASPSDSHRAASPVAQGSPPAEVPRQTASAGPEEPVVTAEPEEPSPAEVEAGVELTRAERRLVQRGLAAAGQSPSSADGLFGGVETHTRRAIRAWQAAKGMEASGYVTQEQAATLIELGRARADDAAYAEAARLDTAEGYAAYPGSVSDGAA